MPTIDSTTPPAAKPVGAGAAAGSTVTAPGSSSDVPDAPVKTSTSLSAMIRQRFQRRRVRVERVARRINGNRTLRVAARIGLGVNSLVHIVLGALAISVALGLGGNASTSSALEAIAKYPGGYVILWVGAGALWALSLWQLTDAVWVTAPKRRLRVTRRLGNVGRAISFAAIGTATAVVAAGLTDGDEPTTYEVGETLLGTTEGAILLIVAGGTIITLGITSIFRGASRNFRQENADLHGAVGYIVDVLGIFGYIAKGFALVVVGALAGYAAIFTDPSQVVGLDGALAYLGRLPLGTTMTAIVGGGFVAYGLYLLARSVYLRTELSRSGARI